MRKFLVILAAAAFVVAVSAPSFAAEWSFYGSSRISTFWTSVDFNDNYPGNGATDNDDTDLLFDLQGNSRIGARVKVTDNLSGHFETGWGSSISRRILWGRYDFGGWALGVGQNYTPLNDFPSNQVFGPIAGGTTGDADMLFGGGGLYNGRRPMIQFEFGNFNFAFVKPITSTANSGGIIADTDVYIPNLQADYTYKAEGFSIKLAGGFQTYDVVAQNDKDDSVMSYMFYAGVQIPLGALYIRPGAYWGQNIGNLGQDNNVDNNFAFIQNNGTALDPKPNVKDTTSWGALGVVGWKMSDVLSFEGGAGYQSSDPDLNNVKKENWYSFYVQAGITLAKGVYLYPEIGYWTQDQNNAGDSGDEAWYGGAKWQINF